MGSRGVPRQGVARRAFTRKALAFVVSALVAATSIVVGATVLDLTSAPAAQAATVCAPSNVLVNTSESPTGRLRTYDHTGALVSNVAVSRFYGDLAFNADGSLLYAVDGATIYRLNPVTGAVLSSVAVSGPAATHLFFNAMSFAPDGRVYLGTDGASTIYLVDPATGVSAVYGGSFPPGVGAGGDFLSMPDGDLVAIGNGSPSQVYRISPSFVTTQVGTVPESWGAASQGSTVVLAGQDGVLRQLATVPTTASTSPLTTTTLATAPGVQFWGAASAQDSGICGGLTVARTQTGTVDLNSDGVIGQGDTVTYSTVVENTGTVALTNVQVTDSLTTASCTPSVPVASLAVGSTVSCTSTYTITASDVAAGSVSSTATASGDGASGLYVETTSSVVVTEATPVTPDITTPAAGSVVADATPAFAGTGLNGATVTVREGATVLCTATVSGGSWSCTSAVSLAEGSHTIEATQRFGSGPASPADLTNLTVDTAAPNPPIITAPADGGYSNSALPLISGTGEPGATVTVREGPTTLCTATVQPDGTFSCTSTETLGEGSHTITASQVDLGGNPSTPDSITFVVDTVDPTGLVVVTPASAAQTNDTTPTISGTGEPGATVTVEEASTTLCAAVVAPDGTWTCVPASPLGNGPHTISVVQTDAAGNSGTPVTRSFTVDAIAPAAPTIDTPLNGSSIGSATPLISGTGEPGATVQVREGAAVLCASVVVDPSGQWSCTSPTLSAGSHTLSADQVDAAGNTSLPASTQFTVDVTPPTAPTIASPTAGQVINDTTPTISGTGETGALVTVREGATVLCTATVVAGAWTCPPLGAPLSEGPHTITARQQDEAGNLSPTASRTFSIDVTAPAALAIVAPATGSTLADATPVVSGTGEPGSTVQVMEGVTSICSTTVDGSGTWSCGSPALTDGAHTFTVTQTDGAGNSGSPSTTTFIVDTTAPAAPVVLAPVDGGIVATSTPPFTGTGEPGALVTVAEGAVTICTATVAGGGTWSCVPTAPLADGSHVVTAVQSDGAGNDSPAVTLTFEVDTVVVAPTIVAPTEGASVNDTTPTFSGIAEPGATVTVTSGADVLCTVVVAGDGTWQCESTVTMATGAATVSATQQDAVGNTSGAAVRNFAIGALITGTVLVVPEDDPAATPVAIAGVVVELWSDGGDGFGNANDVLVATAVTASPYIFSGIPAGTYEVRVPAAANSEVLAPYTPKVIAPLPVDVELATLAVTDLDFTFYTDLPTLGDGTSLASTGVALQRAGLASSVAIALGLLLVLLVPRMRTVARHRNARTSD